MKMMKGLQLKQASPSWFAKMLQFSRSLLSLLVENFTNAYFLFVEELR